jgi:cyclopropane fatty-acyl-phospholipid synthase-like methyltransferase
MKDVKNSVLESLDGTDPDLYPYLPYILQDLWEFGADPHSISSMIRQHVPQKNLSVLDLGCGKGAVSVTVAKDIGCRVKGIDAVDDFIASANQYARQYGVSEQCSFETGDARSKIHEFHNYDIVILGAIGDVFGTLQETLTTVRSCLTPTGYVVLDDGYLKVETKKGCTRILTKSEFYQQITDAGFSILHEEIFPKDKLKKTDAMIFSPIEKRIGELVVRYPDKKDLFLDYLRSQEYENDMLENSLITGTWLLQTISK